MKVFFAIEFEEQIKDYLFDIQNELKRYCTGGNFSRKQNFHLTLRFMGERNEMQIEQLKTVLSNTARDTRKFELKLGGLGNFSKGSKKIIWLGLRKSKELQLLYGRLEEQLRIVGYEKEDRSYNPHITLVREAGINDLGMAAEAIKTDGVPVCVRSVSLMESTRVDNKLSYIAVKSQLLEAENQL